MRVAFALVLLVVAAGYLAALYLVPAAFGQLVEVLAQR